MTFLPLTVADAVRRTAPVVVAAVVGVALVLPELLPLVVDVELPHAANANKRMIEKMKRCKRFIKWYLLVSGDSNVSSVMVERGQ